MIKKYKLTLLHSDLEKKISMNQFPRLVAEESPLKKGLTLVQWEKTSLHK